MADSSTTTAPILNLIAGDCWARRQLRNGIRYVPVTSKPRKSLSSVERILLVALAIFYSTADYSTTTGRILIPFARDCWARRQLSNGIRYVSVASKPRISLSSVEGILGIKLAIFYSTANYSTTAGRILILFAEDCRAQRQLHNGIRYVSVTSTLMKSLSPVEGISGITSKLAIFYSMADYSTTAGRILILFAGDSWARRQPPKGIRYVSVASKLRKSLSSVEGVLGITGKLAIFYSMADYSTTAGLILILFAGDCWSRRQLPNGIRYVSVASKPRKSLSSVEGVLGITGKLAIFYSMADYSTTAGRTLILFAGGCWARRQLRNGISFISPRSLFIILQGPG